MKPIIFKTLSLLIVCTTLIAVPLSVSAELTASVDVRELTTDENGQSHAVDHDRFWQP